MAQLRLPGRRLHPVTFLVDPCPSGPDLLDYLAQVLTPRRSAAVATMQHSRVADRMTSTVDTRCAGLSDRSCGTFPHVLLMLPICARAQGESPVKDETLTRPRARAQGGNAGLSSPISPGRRTICGIWIAFALRPACWASMSSPGLGQGDGHRGIAPFSAVGDYAPTTIPCSS